MTEVHEGTHMTLNIMCI